MATAIIRTKRNRIARLKFNDGKERFAVIIAKPGERPAIWYVGEMRDCEIFADVQRKFAKQHCWKVLIMAADIRVRMPARKVVA